jgi:hypothetical protein
MNSWIGVGLTSRTKNDSMRVIVARIVQQIPEGLRPTATSVSEHLALDL